MKITLYTINDCQYSKAEKEYLHAHNLPYEEKNLETNKEFLTEMLTVANDFAGTPVTKIEKDDGQIAILKGYTKEEFDKMFNITAGKTTTVNSTINPPPVNPAPQAPVQNIPNAPSLKNVPPTQPEKTPTPTVSQVPNQNNPKINSVLNNLQSKIDPAAETNPTPPASPASTQTTPNTLPNIPEPDFK